MILKKLFLKNIRIFEEETINFPRGVVLLEGDIGSGKTTILKSIEFALFGAGPNLRASTLLKKGQTSASVNLLMEIDGKSIMIKRGLKKNTGGEIVQTKSELTIGNMSYLCSPKEMRSKIIALLNYPADMITKNPALLFRYTVYNPQEETKQILRMKKEERSDIFGKIFSTDQYKQIKENAIVFKKSIREEGDYLRGVFNNLVEYKSREKTQKQELKELEKKTKAEEEQAGKLRNEVDSINKKYETLVREEARFNEIKRKCEIQNSLHNEKNQYLAELKEREKCEKKSIEKIQFQIKEIPFAESKKFDRSEISLLNERKREKEKQIEEHSDAKKEIQIKLAQIRQSIKISEKIISKQDETNDKITWIHDRINAIEQYIKDNSPDPAQLSGEEKLYKKNRDLLSSKSTEIKIMKKEIEQITSLSACPLCRQKIDQNYKSNIVGESRKIIEMTEAELKKIEAEAKISEEKILLLRKKINEISIKKEEMKYLQKQFLELKEEEARILKEKKQHLMLKEQEQKFNLALDGLEKFRENEIKEEIKDIDKKIIDLEKLKKDIERRDELIKFAEEKKQALNGIESTKKKTAKSITELTKSIALQKKQMEEYRGLEEKMKKTRKMKDEASALLEDKKIAIAEATTQLKLLEKQNEEIKKSITSMKESKKKHEKISQTINWLDNLYIPLVKNIETNVLARIHFEFEDVFSRWFGMMINSDFFSTYIDEEFTPIIEQSGFEIEFDNLSGGEQTAVALCYRLALNQVINNVTKQINTKDIIILDEPTDGFSHEQLEQLGIVIGALKLSQIIIVSHEQRLRSFADNIIYLEKTGNRSSVV